MKSINQFILESSSPIKAAWQSTASFIQYGKEVASMKKSIRNIFFDTKPFYARTNANSKFRSFLSYVVIYPYLQDIKWNDAKCNYSSTKINVKDFYNKYFQSPEDFVKIKDDKNYQGLSYWHQLLKKYVENIEITLEDPSSTEYKNMKKYWEEALEEANSNNLLDKLIDFYEKIYKDNKEEIEKKVSKDQDLWKKTNILTSKRLDIDLYV
jgi:hypothetical protein